VAVYLYHFSRPYVTNTGRLIYHYCGYTRHTNDPRRRLRQHVSGYGNPFVAAVVMAGIKVRIVKVWDEGGEFETRLKKQHNLRRCCPICHPRLLKEQRHKYQLKKRQQNHSGKQETAVLKPRKTRRMPDVVGPTPQALAKAARERRLEEIRQEELLRHPCEACGRYAKWPSRVCNRCSSGLTLVRQYDAEDPYRHPDLLERLIRNEFSCPLELVLDLLEKETRDENALFI
jgi:hypothetical protein